MDLAKEFEAAATKRMEEEGFVLFKRTYTPNRDDIALTYCKINNPKCCSVMASGLDLLQATDVAALATAKAETAIRYYQSGTTK